jgi:hypothetical protein
MHSQKSPAAQTVPRVIILNHFRSGGVTREGESKSLGTVVPFPLKSNITMLKMATNTCKQQPAVRPCEKLVSSWAFPRQDQFPPNGSINSPHQNT